MATTGNSLGIVTMGYYRNSASNINWGTLATLSFLLQSMQPHSHFWISSKFSCFSCHLLIIKQLSLNSTSFKTYLAALSIQYLGKKRAHDSDPWHLLFSVSRCLQFLLSQATGLEGGNPSGSWHLLSLLPSLHAFFLFQDTLISTFLGDSTETALPVLRMALQTPQCFNNLLCSLSLLIFPVPKLNTVFQEWLCTVRATELWWEKPGK